MLGIIEEVKKLFKSKAEKKTESKLQEQGEKPEDNTKEQTTYFEEGGSN